jgi:epoxyqueuosine reductase
MSNRKENSIRIKEKAIQLGFDACGISKAGYLKDDALRLQKWLERGMQGEMSYLANYFEKRPDPRKLVEGAKSVISVILNYFPREQQSASDIPIISKYAYGEDYHFVMKRMLKSLLKYISENIEPVNGRAFVDSAPVLERAWAVKAGLGWIGKNGMLISKEHGSFVFLGELMIDLELDYDKPEVKDYCGSCTACIDACPTGAVLPGKVVDGSQCISYFTIEKKGEIPAEMKGRFENRIFGCDICQDVCPWNKKTKPHNIKEFDPDQEWLKMDKDEWKKLSLANFNRIFKNSALKRTKYEGLMRNLEFLG